MRPLARVTALVALALVAVTATTGGTATARDSRAPLEGRLLDRLGGRVQVTRHDETGHIASIRGRGGRALADAGALGHPSTPRAAAGAFLGRFGELFGIASPGRQLRVARVDRPRGLPTFVRYQQLVGGHPVLGGELVVAVSRRMGVLAIRGETTPAPAIEARARVSAGRATRIALAAVGRSTGRPLRSLRAERPAQWVYDPRLLGAPGLPYPRLVWRTRVTATDGSLDQFVAIDARSGAVALRFDQLRSADAVQRICDQQERRESVLDLLPCRASDASALPSGVPDVQRAQAATEATYDFFLARFGFDLAAQVHDPLVSTVRYCPSPAGGTCPYQNAFWDGTQMVYGTGFASADDVVGHELGHGVTERTSDLFYYMQSGAINEAFSDIVGELIDQASDLAFDTDSDDLRWLIGEDIPLVGAIRDMADPARFGQPDRMTSELYDPDRDEVDGGGVHINSGVANRALVLMVDGGALGGVSVPPLHPERSAATDQAAAIWFLAGTQLLTSASDYADLADALQAACGILAATPGAIRDATGSPSVDVDAGDCGGDGSVAAAIAATELRTSPPSAPVTRVRPCTDPNAEPVMVGTLFFDPIDAAGSGWVFDKDGPNRRWWTWDRYGFPDPAAPDGPVAHLVGDDLGQTGDRRVRRAQPALIPDDGRPVFLWFRHAYGFDDGSQDAIPNENRYDGGVVEVQTPGRGWRDVGPLFIDHPYDGTIFARDTNPLKGRRAFTAESHGYVTSRAVLTGFPGLSFAGDALTLGFRIGTDSTFGGEGWFIDDVRLYQCSDTADDAPPTVGAPAVALRPGTVTTRGKAPVRVTVEASDPSGIALVRLEAAYGDEVAVPLGTSAAARVAQTTLRTSASVAHRILAAATDEQGNASPASSTNVRVVLTEESGLRFRGPWSTSASPASSGGAVRFSGTAGRRATLTVDGARGIALVTTLGPDRGKARICVDGEACRVVDLYSPTFRRRQVVDARAWDGAARRTISITVLGTRRSLSSGDRVDVDAIVAVTD